MSAKVVTHATPPIAFQMVNTPNFILPRPQTKGAKVLKNGMKRVITTVSPPYLSKKLLSLSMRSFVMPLTLPDLIILSPKKRAIQ